MGLIAFGLAAHERFTPFQPVVYHAGGKGQVSALATYTQVFGFADKMWRFKPIRQRGQHIETLPSFTIPEAAVFLAIPRRTLFDWYVGQNPALKPSGSYGDISLLSFRDVEEAYKLHILRDKEHFSLQYLRDALSEARKHCGSEHPLIDDDIVVMNKLVMNIPGRGRRPRKSIGLASPERPDYFPEVVKTWGKRIVTDRRGGITIFPWRYFETDDKSRPVSMNADVMSGRLVVTGTRIPVNILWGRSLSGESAETLAKDYHIGTDLVRNALKHIDKDAAKAA